MKVLSIVLLLAGYLGVAESCMCMPTHPQNAFCKSEFVLKAAVTSWRRYTFIKNYELFVQMGIPPPRMAYYSISVVKIFKGKDKIQHLLKNPVFFTHAQDIISNCGKFFNKGEKYLLAGRLVDGQMQTSMCDMNSKWHDVTKQMKLGINGMYDCNCAVATCVDGYCDRKNSCKWNVTWDKPIDECSMNHRSCGKSEKGCVWNSSSQYAECRRQENSLV
ncbi:metalloproteinase inhibitor 3-like [Hydractinia symbiolongicarpus]|uniref:metalloproteinase inhibitor 3-like n=1 Tax=Hydractinia symbiolongicarpus TaxID=13093 RepID=UPI0025519A34|nr:metalloproteinase inhibitor 3-like [Hydractinia symbiolongicarpus]